MEYSKEYCVDIYYYIPMHTESDSKNWQMDLVSLTMKLIYSYEYFSNYYYYIMYII